VTRPVDQEPIDAPTASAVMERAERENFPVAARLLGRRLRRHLLAVYGFARLADELGDAFAGDRLAALDWLEGDLDRAYRGQAQHPLLKRLASTLRECELPREPFVRLIEANRVDQRVGRYETWEQLRAYCALSADPVGELVLGIFGQVTPAHVALSDDICTALQLVEHCQDVPEDLARGRVYLPAEDLARFGCTLSDPSDLSNPSAPSDPSDPSALGGGAPLRATLAFECSRARELLASGAPLIDRLHGRRARLAVAAFVAGGRAALGALERADYDVSECPPSAGAMRRALALVATIVERRR
jgi:squalene synthase HpnC